MNYNELCEAVISLVEEAARRIEGKSFSATAKGNFANIVTTSDIETQHFLYEGLSWLIPSSSFFCEEEGLQDTSSEHVWIIDPIDGTTNYSRGITECGISVALLKSGDPTLSVVYNIFSHDVFSAVCGCGAFLNGKPISVSKRSFADGLFCSAMSLYKKDLARICSDIIYDVYLECNDLRRLGSCTIELCYLAAGMCDLYFEIRVFPWDFAGAYLILKEAGGIITGLDGEPPSFSAPTALIAANSKENYERLRSIVSRHLTKLPYED